MEIKVTGCHDCPFCTGFTNKCEINKEYNGVEIITQSIHQSCPPLLKESITITTKPKDNE